MDESSCIRSLAEVSRLVDNWQANWNKQNVKWNLSLQCLACESNNSKSVEICCMTQWTQTRALWHPGGVGWDGKREGSSRGKATYVYLWLIHVDVWQKPIQYCNYLSTKNKEKQQEKVLNQPWWNRKSWEIIVRYKFWGLDIEKLREEK